MNATANLLAVSPDIRWRLEDWQACERNRIEAGFDWTPAAWNARAMCESTMARAAEIARDAAQARQMLTFGRGHADED
jgi:hypothetical protein